ncbi:MAG TPA: glutamate-1-semialdehyde 2,1-aminomutase [Verrucomicrobiota bacterium]|nr:glutamate-1-semialdehyde-2,1-aminomutase [Verrucomicrobiales bacterium]HRI14774.1 glutamate-1-semialdehyde 2,1-aminomutase [Verrucomicrobiota bacterium]
MSSRLRSAALFAEALEHLPGGVNSPVRAFRAVGGQPFFVESAQGSRLRTVDGDELLDYVCTWGPAILGHAHPKIVSAIKSAADRGTSFGIPNPLEVTLAARVKEWVPSVAKIRFCNSGTEACMSAIRLARGFTRRDKILKFDGCYHGHADSLLVKAGSGALTFGHPDSAGVPADFARHTLVLPYNDGEALRAAFNEHGRELAAVIVEGVPANAGLYLPRPGYYQLLTDLCDQHGTLLIFDEVMTGFRLGRGGAQERFGVTPDLSCFGKIIGGGLPVGAFGGRADIMDYLAPLGPVYQAGTLSGNPLAMAAGLAALDELAQVNAFPTLEARGSQLAEGMIEAAKSAGVSVQWQWIGSMFCGYFTDAPVWNLTDALRSDLAKFAKFFHGMLAEAIYLAPSQFEAGFISLAHSEADLDQTVRAAAKVLRTL